MAVGKNLKKHGMVAIARHETAIARDRDRAIAQKLSRSHTRKSGDRARSRKSPWGKNFFCGGKFFFVQEKNFLWAKKPKSDTRWPAPDSGTGGTQVHPECQSQGSPPMT